MKVEDVEAFYDGFLEKIIEESGLQSWGKLLSC